jgi:ubiquinone/menaquinone biosynthesis C-methylase UbiE
MTNSDILFTKLAKYYDLTHHFRDYPQQAEFLHAAIQKYLPSANHVLDIPCGTGSHALILAEKGYHVTGVDASSDMLKIAKQKAGTSDNLNFILGDMCSLTFSSEFDVAYCLGLSFMQLTSYGQISSCLESVKRALKPHGLFIFDVSNGWEMLQVETQAHTSQDGYAKVIWLSSGYIDKMKRIQHLDCSFTIQEGDKTSIESFAEELRIFFPDEIEMLLRRGGFSVLALLGSTSLNEEFQPESKYIVAIAKQSNH